MKITYRADAPLVQAVAFAGDTPHLVERGQTIDVPDDQAAELLKNPHFIAADAAAPAAAPAPHVEPDHAPAHEAEDDSHF